MKISIKTIVNAPLARVWTCWTNPNDIKNWNFASEDWHCPRSTNDLKVGGKFSSRMEARNKSMGFDFEGIYTQIEDQSLIEYKLDDGRIVSIVFSAQKDGIEVIETFECEDEHSGEQQKQGWQSILNNFKKYVED